MRLSSILNAYSRDTIESALDHIASEYPTIPSQYRLEWLGCYLSPAYFINTYVYIYDTVSTGWIPFRLWHKQVETLAAIDSAKKFVGLKARQVGLTKLCISYILHNMVFRQPANALVMSKRDTESVAAISIDGLRGSFDRLPDWMKPNVVKDDAHTFSVSYNNRDISSVRAMSTSSGDSYSATIALIDEADLIPDLDKALLSLEPTVNAGGKLLLISKADRSSPKSKFKEIYRAARANDSEYASAFIAWDDHPGRDREWYSRVCRDAIAIDGNLDSVYESYPATDTEALSYRSSDSRYPVEHIDRCYKPSEPIDISHPIPYTTIYQYRDRTRGYVIGVDTAEGLPTSDYSTAIVMDSLNGRIVAYMQGKITPEIQADYVHRLSTYYDHAPVLVERNNHGHSFINSAKQLGLVLLTGLDKRVGWQTNTTSKVMLCDALAASLRDNDITIPADVIKYELLSIAKNTLAASAGMYDDLHMATALANIARPYGKVSTNLQENIAINIREW